MNYYLHNVPGRLRVKIPAIRCRQDDCLAVEDMLRDLDGVANVTVNPVTGSVLVNYDCGLIDPKDVLRLLEEKGYFDPSSAVTRETSLETMKEKARYAVGKAVFGWAVDRALEANGLSFLAAFI
jgi:copper chaperone CopZ